MKEVQKNVIIFCFARKNLENILVLINVANSRQESALGVVVEQLRHTFAFQIQSCHVFPRSMEAKVVVVTHSRHRSSGEVDSLGFLEARLALPQ